MKTEPFIFLSGKMPYVYVGHPSVYHGKKLFKILCQLKNFGQGRIIYRSTEQVHPEPSFYRILLAQPEMDSKLDLGRVVAEQVFRGKRRTEVVNLSAEAHYPDFKLVPKDQEAEFCRWNEVEKYNAEVHAEAKPKYIEMPPLLQLFVKRNRELHGESNLCTPKNMRLPAHKIYQGEFRLEDRVEPNSMEHYLSEKFATHKDFDVKRVPKEWNLERLTTKVGHKIYLSKREGTTDYKKWIQRQEESNQ